MMYEYWLAKLRRISEKKKRTLRDIFGSAKALYYIEETKLEGLLFLEDREKEVIKKAMRDSEEEVKKEYCKLEKAGITFVPYFSEDYPKRLQAIPDIPYALYVKGKLPPEKGVTAAIVGARQCTSYGEGQALEYGRVLASAGVCIISGMARGIDGAGQRGALNGGGETYGVLGCGVDICYPRENFGLYMDIQEKGGILAEFPPGTKPFPYHFPLRNRIISALSDYILVMEAREQSGSLITADLALEQGKDVFALPGPVTNPLSHGCHRLLKEGAGILISPKDLLDEMNLCSSKVGQIIFNNEKILETQEKLVYSCLGFSPKDVEQVAKETRLSAREVMQQLCTLQMRGIIKEISKNYYVRIC